MIGGCLVALAFIAVGRVLYRRRWPDGFIAREDDRAELDRVRRTGRKRVLPAPEREGRGGR